MGHTRTGTRPSRLVHMVDVDITSNELVLHLRGLHQLWAFRREVRIPWIQIQGVQQGISDEARDMRAASLRLPGTSLPCLVAGSYRSRGGWAFWDVAGNGSGAITLMLEGHRYTYVVVDVADPGAALSSIQRARRRAGAK